MFVIMVNECGIGEIHLYTVKNKSVTLNQVGYISMVRLLCPPSPTRCRFSWHRGSLLISSCDHPQKLPGDPVIVNKSVIIWSKFVKFWNLVSKSAKKASHWRRDGAEEWSLKWITWFNFSNLRIFFYSEELTAEGPMAF